MLKSVFFGTPDFALPSLSAARLTTQVLAVVTQPDRPRGRGQKLLPCEVKAQALEAGIPCFSPASLRKPSPELDALMDCLLQNKPDLFLVTAYGNILPEKLLAIPRLGSINVHASLLPRWRGAAPIQRALEAGDPFTGVSLQKIVYELDAGDVLGETQHPLPPSTDAAEATAALSRLGGLLLQKYLGEMGEGPLVGKAQDPALITHAAKITKEEGLWSPDWTALEAHNRIRAFCVWPTVRARFVPGGVELKLVRAERRSPPRPLAPGEILLHEKNVFLGVRSAGPSGDRSAGPSGVRTGEAMVTEALVLQKIQVPGKPPVVAFDYFQNFGKESKLEKI